MLFFVYNIILSIIIKKRFCNISSSLVYAELTDDDINHVQQFIRSDLYEILAAKCEENGSKYEEKNDSAFFGTYGAHREKFTFSKTEINIIKLLRDHIQETTEDLGEEMGHYHFALKYTSEGDNKEFEPIEHFIDELKNDQIELQNWENESTTHTFLKKLTCTADRNLSRTKSGYRFDSDIIDFSAMIRMIGGPFLYQTMHSNIPLAIPSLSTTNRYITKTNGQTIEGQLRVAELSRYLDRRGLARVVVLSEDATRINNTVQYDAKTNEILGFVLPADKNGMPIPHSYLATSFSEICDHFSKKTCYAHYVNVVMAQPLGKVPAFCLLLFGSDGKYTAEDVSKRWQFIKSELAKQKISVLAVSSDSDPRYNSAMRKISKLGLSSKILGDKDWFSMGVEFSNSELYCIQDIIHIATKLRNRLLSTMRNPKMLPFAPNQHIKCSDLEQIIKRFTKDQHCLTATVLNPIDRQNFKSVLRICDALVTSLLSSNVKGSEGTVKFLQITRDIIDAYTDVSLKPLERIEKMWNALFIIRIWRNYILEHKRFTLGKNFLTHNCYTCIELNAHSLVAIMLYLKNNNMSQLFIPSLLQSQACESFFRQIRSMSTVFYTVTNCSIRDLIKKLNRIELQSEIALFSDLEFPRIKKTHDSTFENTYELPTEEEIIKQIEQCQHEAIQYAIKNRMIQEVKHTQKQLKMKTLCGVEPLSFREPSKNAFSDDDISDIDITMGNSQTLDNSVYLTSYVHGLKTLALQNFAALFDGKEVPENSIYAEIFVGAVRKVIKKSSLVWLLRKDPTKLSSDRLQRVKTRITRKKSHRIQNKQKY